MGTQLPAHRVVARGRSCWCSCSPAGFASSAGVPSTCWMHGHAGGQHARSHARTGRQRSMAASSLVKKMGCHIAGETWVPTARRERTDSTTKITSGSRSEGRGHAVPAPPAGEA